MCVCALRCAALPEQGAPLGSFPTMCWMTSALSSTRYEVGGRGGRREPRCQVCSQQVLGLAQHVYLSCGGRELLPQGRCWRHLPPVAALLCRGV